ncbi:unnamed protein product [Prunus armeniaca]
MEVLADFGLRFRPLPLTFWGSGGTIVGLALSSWLSSLKAKVHAFSVCDDPDYFYDYVQGLLDGLEAGVDSRDIVNIQNVRELKFVTEIAATTGIVLDPVYSGKAAYGMLKDMAENAKKWEGRKILFIQRVCSFPTINKMFFPNVEPKRSILFGCR